MSSPTVLVPALSLSLEDAASALGVSVRRVYDWANDGTLEVWRNGRNRRVSVAALQRFIDRQEAAERERRGLLLVPRRQKAA